MHPPLFIVGTGRSGTTVFFQMMLEHPQAAWFSGLLERWPHRPALNTALMRLAAAAPGDWLARRRIGMSEVYNYWDRLSPGFSTPCRDLLAGDLTPKAAAKIRQAAAQAVTQRRPRFMAKITGWPRIGFLAEALAGARFVHIRRDGRAVANSLLHMPWWWGWRGPANWRWGPLTPDDQALWDETGRDFAALAGIQWLILMRAFAAATAAAPAGSVLDITYEDLCADRMAVFERVCQFAGLPLTPLFKRRLMAYNLKNTNDKWRSQLSPAQQQALCHVLDSRMAPFGYAG